MYLGGNMPIRQTSRFWTTGRPLLSPSKGKDMNKDQLSTGYRLPQKMKLAGTGNILNLLLYFSSFFFFCHYNRHFKLKKEVKKNFTTIGKSLETLHFTTQGFIWRLWTNWSPSGGQQGVADSFVQIAEVPWGRPLGMPAGKCVRLSLNEKLSKVQLLRLRATFHALPLFYLRKFKFYARSDVRIRRHWISIPSF